eukprot:3374147-Heterocapsa_arctica.AAC.1
MRCLRLCEARSSSLVRLRAERVAAANEMMFKVYGKDYHTQCAIYEYASCHVWKVCREDVCLSSGGGPPDSVTTVCAA